MMPVVFNFGSIFQHLVMAFELRFLGRCALWGSCTCWHGRRASESVVWISQIQWTKVVPSVVQFFLLHFLIFSWKNSRKEDQEIAFGKKELIFILCFSENFGIELSSQEVPLQVLSSIYNVSQLSSKWISVVPLSTLKTPKQKSTFKKSTL